MPFLQEQAAARRDSPASMALDDIAARIKLVVEVTVSVEDVRESAAPPIRGGLFLKSELPQKYFPHR